MLAKLFLILFCAFNQVFGATQPPCTIQIKTQLGKPTPLLLNGNSIIEPANGEIKVNQGSTLELFCTDQFSSTVPNAAGLQSLNVKCISGQSFEVPAAGAGSKAKSVNINKITCNSKSKAVLQMTGSRGHLQYGNVGFPISKTRFIPLYSICFDTITEAVVYSLFQMTKAIAFSQTSSRPNFSEDPCYTCPCSDAYPRATQKETICQDILKIKTDSAECVALFGASIRTGQKYLAKGHLAANADFVYEFEQHASFRLCNAAPEWQAINNGNWRTLEKGVRDFVAAKGLTVDIYTGTHGVLKLRSSTTRQQHDITLEKNGKIPVPMYFFKVVIDKLARRGIAFVAVNNPYLAVADILRDHRFCTDVRSQFGNAANNWPSKFGSSDFTDASKGYIYACEVGDFMNTVTNLPSGVRSEARGLLI